MDKIERQKLVELIELLKANDKSGVVIRIMEEAEVYTMPDLTEHLAEGAELLNGYYGNLSFGHILDDDYQLINILINSLTVTLAEVVKRVEKLCENRTSWN